MRQNTLRGRYRAGRPAFGVTVAFPSPGIVELLGYLGFDWVFLDAEHGNLTDDACEQMIRAAEVTGITPLVWLPQADDHVIQRYLDLGALGIVVPHLSSRAAAEAAVAAAKYAPQGRRGSASATRAADYGLRFTPGEYAAWANAATLVFGVLEDAEVLQTLPELLEVAGLDGFVIGPGDLSHSLGLPGQVGHPRVQAAVDEITRLVLASDKALCRLVGGSANLAEEVNALVQQGVPLIAQSFLTLARRGAQDFLKLRPG